MKPRPPSLAVKEKRIAARAWQRMLSGRRLDLLDPSALDIEIEDIAHGLARVARWNGQTVGAHIFSVAQHTLLVEAIARARMPSLDRRARLAILLHDAPEYVIGDLISPFKAVLDDAYKVVEQRLLWPARRVAGAARPADQGRRPRRRLPGSHAPCRLRHRRGAPLLWGKALAFARNRARLSHSLARAGGRAALS